VSEPTVKPKKGLRFSPEVNAGHILTAIMIAFGIVGGYSAFYSRLSILEYKQLQTDQLVTELRNGNTTTGVAIQELRSGNLRLVIIAEQMQKQLERKQ
jgi:hypothetical protein